MSFTAFQWAVAFHVLGVILWVGSMISLSLLLASESAKTDGGLLTVAKKIARVMDIGALIAIVCGIYILVRTKGFGDAWALKQPWMHIKLTVVLLAVFGGHGFVEATLKRLRNGSGKPLPAVVPLVILAATAVVVILAVAKPLTKGG